MSALPRIPVRHLARLFAVVLTGVSAGSLSGQAVEPRAPVERTEVGGRMHMQFATTSVDGVPSSEFVLRRARIWAAARVNEWIDGAVQVDFSNGQVSARYAFVRFSMDPALRVSVGQFKRAFDLFELTSSSEILVVERDGQIEGVDACGALGGVCSYSRFSEKLQFSSLDVGILLQGDLAEGKVGYLVSVTNGPGGNQAEDNDAKSWSSRLEWRPRSGVTVGGNLGMHDFTNPVLGVATYAPVGAVDVELGDFDRGFHLQAGVMTGENWRNLDAGGAGSRFLAAQTIATYRVPVEGNGKVRAVEPVARVSWGDPDRGRGGDGGVLLTPGVVLHFEGRNKIGVNLDGWRGRAGETAWGLKLQSYLYF